MTEPTRADWWQQPWEVLLQASGSSLGNKHQGRSDRALQFTNRALSNFSGSNKKFSVLSGHNINPLTFKS